MDRISALSNFFIINYKKFGAIIENILLYERKVLNLQKNKDALSGNLQKMRWEVSDFS